MESWMTRFLLLFTFTSLMALENQNSAKKPYLGKLNVSLLNGSLSIVYSKDEEIITGNVGIGLVGKILPTRCLTKNSIDRDHCYQWEEKATLDIQGFDLDETTRCYNTKWTSLRDSKMFIDCFKLDEKEHWYGGGQNAQSSYHLDQAPHDFAPFITGRVGDHKWGNVLKRYFINSRGVAILVDHKTPLHTNLNRTSKQFCIKAQYDDFAYVNHVNENIELNYTVCVSNNTALLHSKLTDNTLWEGLKKKDFEYIDNLIHTHILEVKAISEDLNQEMISNFATDVIQLGFLKLGHIVIDGSWQKHIGDFTMDPERFSNFDDIIHGLHRRGFKIILSIQPFISTESSNFAEAVKKEIFISERSCDHRIPALTRYKSMQTAGVLDPTKKATKEWLLKKLKDLSVEYDVDGFHLDTGISYDIPHYYQYGKDIVNPDHYHSSFLEILKDVNLFGVSASITRPKPLTLVALPQLESSWIGLRKVIPLMLTYGLLGYHFLMPAAIGGDFNVGNSTGQPSTIKSLPDQELYLRWLQMASFMPIMKFVHLPSSYNNASVVDIARNVTKLRESKVLPLLKKYSRVALDKGLPIIRPLWMIDSNDSTCHEVEDEFSIGDELIVAPILYAGKKSRNIYLPPGIWMDGFDGSLHKGGQWLNDYSVTEQEIPYFEKMPSINNI